MTSRRSGWRPIRRRQRAKRVTTGRKPSIGAHLFERDPRVTREPYTGLDTCRRCGQLGEPGDRRHTVKPQTPPDPPPPDLARAWAEHDAAILGESWDD